MLSPEQLTNFGGVGPSCDLYSAAATLFRLLTNQSHLRSRTLAHPVGPNCRSRDAPKSSVPCSISSRTRGRPHDLIDGLLTLDPSFREGLSAQQIAQQLERFR